MQTDVIYNENCITGLAKLPDNCVDCCVTSPPYYGLRDYGIEPTYWQGGSYVPMAGLPEVAVTEWTGCLGLEPTLVMFVWHIVLVFREVRRVLKSTGTLWLNFADSYCSTAPGTMGDNIHIKGTLEATKRARKTKRPNHQNGLKPKDLMGAPWRVAFALQADGWWLRQDVIWAKPNPMPESVTDRCTKAHEYMFLLSKSARYCFDAEAIAEPVTGSTMIRMSQDIEHQQGSEVPGKTNGPMKAYAPRYGGNKYTADTDVFSRTKSGNAYDYRPMRNKRSVWMVATQPYSEAHFATYPEKLIEPCIQDVLNMFAKSAAVHGDAL